MPSGPVPPGGPAPNPPITPTTTATPNTAGGSSNNARGSSSSSSSSADKGKLSDGGVQTVTIIGAVAAVVIIGLIVAICFICFLMRKASNDEKKKQQQQKAARRRRRNNRYRRGRDDYDTEEGTPSDPYTYEDDEYDEEDEEAYYEEGNHRPVAIELQDSSFQQQRRTHNGPHLLAQPYVPANQQPVMAVPIDEQSAGSPLHVNNTELNYSHQPSPALDSGFSSNNFAPQRDELNSTPPSQETGAAAAARESPPVPGEFQKSQSEMIPMNQHSSA